MHFYELHEGDADLFFDVMLAHEEEMDAEEFFTIVQGLRHKLQDGFDTDTLVEAIAGELEREYGFIFISDDRLTAAVNVSRVEDDNFLADLEGEEEDDVEVTGDADYRGVYAKFDPSEDSQN
ncbi:MAG: hypothetical protein ABI598_01210 [Chloroflexota bacterium]